MQRLTTFVLMVLAIVLLPMGCTTPTTSQTFPPYSFSSSGIIKLNVADIQFSEEYTSPFGPPNVEHKFPIKPMEAVKGLVNDRFRAVGTVGTLRVRITDASVTEEKLQETPGVRGVFTADQSERYSGAIRIVMEIEEPGHYLPRSTFTSYAKRSGTVSEYMTYNDRQKYFYDFTYQLLNQLNQEISRNIAQDFQRYIVQ